MILTTFYRGRPTRGTKLTPVGKVLWSGKNGQWDYDKHKLVPGTDEGPWREESHSAIHASHLVALYVTRGLHRIDRKWPLHRSQYQAKAHGEE